MSNHFSPQNPCPVCGGNPNARRGDGTRCAGWLSPDLRIAFCMREEKAGGLTAINPDGSFAHFLAGQCNCGEYHASASAPVARATRQGDPPTARATPDRQGDPTAIYTYKDEFGDLLFQVRRYGSGSGKTFLQYRYSGKSYVPGLGDTRRVLYRLPELLESDPDKWVLIAEGEKDVDTLRQAGFIATCNPMGAGKWRDEYNKYLEGRHVVIIPDKDTPGEAHAYKIASALAGVAATVTVLAMPSDYKDATDYLTEGGAEFFDKRASALADMIQSAPEYQPDPQPLTRQENGQKLLTVAELAEIPPPQWLIAPDLQRDSIAMLIGSPGIGKTFLALDYAMRVAQTENVIYIAGEGATGLYQRISAWATYYNGSVERLRIYTEAVQVTNPVALAEFTATVAPLRPALIIVDTLRRASIGLDENSSKDMSVVEASLQQLRRATGACIFVLHHTNKGGKYSGSTALLSQPDTFLLLTRVGSLVRLSCTKQRNAEESESRLIGFLQTNDTLVCVSPEKATDRQGAISEVEKLILEATAQSIFTENGISSKVLKDIVDAPASSIYNGLSSLKDKGYITQGQRGDPYKITVSGRDVIGAGASPWQDGGAG